MNYMENCIENLTDKELKKCFDYITECNKINLMKNTLEKQITDNVSKETKNTNWDTNCRMITVTEILYEIAKRYFDK